MDRRIGFAALVVAVFGLALMARQAAEAPGNSISLLAVLLTWLPLSVLLVYRLLKRR
ncbi:hypothetical protein [Sandarakinorhabdus cyanobacteriorum]|uniref:hypothetical protein n=1 Tax=Sandarakinorhabdus cyanobacteriorum TaxID=1981098 RepID=UPI0013FDA750|nr:hypothetical protein [Sandarakinorhabdus cyanobacteriorum]